MTDIATWALIFSGSLITLIVGLALLSYQRVVFREKERADRFARLFKHPVRDVVSEDPGDQ